MPNYTDNYSLEKPLPEEFYDVGVQNRNMDEIDAALVKKVELDENGKIPQEQLPPMDYIPTAQKGAANGVAPLGGDRKIAESYLPPLNFDPAGAAATVQQNLNAHKSNIQNPHATTAAQVGADPKTSTLTAESNLADGDHFPFYDASAAAQRKTLWSSIKTALGFVSNVLSVARGGTGKASWTANRMIYPSAGTTLTQMPAPTVAKSMLQQDPSGAPYWGTPEQARESLDVYTKLQTLSAAVKEAYGLLATAVPNEVLALLAHARHYGKYIQVSGAASSLNGFTSFSKLENDDYNAMNLVTYPSRIMIPTGAKKVRLLIRFNQINVSYKQNGYTDIYKDGAILESGYYSITSDGSGNEEHLGVVLISKIINANGSGGYLQLYSRGDVVPPIIWAMLEVIN